MIRDHNPVVLAQGADEPPVQKRPGGITVEHDQRLASTFIQVMQAMVSNGEVVALELVARKSLGHMDCRHRPAPHDARRPSQHASGYPVSS